MSYLSTAPAGGAGSGTVTQVNSGVGLTGGPITGVGTLDFATSLQPMATLTGNASKYLRVNAGETAVEYATLTSAPAGSDTQVQFNDSGVMAGDANLVFNKTTPYLRVGGAFVSESGVLRVNGAVFAASGFSIPGLTTLSLSSLYSSVAFDLRGYNGTVQTPIIQFTNSGTANLAANFNTWVGINSSLPTHSLTLGSTATGVALYNTADQITNYERVRQYWSGNIFTIGTEQSGTGGYRGLTLASGNGVTQIKLSSNSSPAVDFTRSATNDTTGPQYRLSHSGLTAASGTQTFLSLAPTISQTGTAGWTALLVNPSADGTGSGTKLLADLQVASVSKFRVLNTGVTHTIMPDTSTAILSTTLNAPGATTGLEFRFNSAIAGTNVARIMAVVGSGGGGDLNFDTAPAGGSAYTTKMTLTRAGDLFLGANLELGNASDTTISRSSAGVLAVEGVVIPSVSSTNTLTNKRITPRVGTATSSATPTINTDDVDFYSLTAQAADITSFTTNLLGTPTDGQKLWIAITGTAARAITWGASFEASTVALPTTTVTTNRLDVGFVWNAVTSKWRCIASG